MLSVESQARNRSEAERKQDCLLHADILLGFLFNPEDFSFIHQQLYGPLLGPGLFFSFVIIFRQTVGLLG
jgi:hypothetical protein